MSCVSRQWEPLCCRGLAITMGDFRAAIARVQPSVRREGFTTTPDITWDDVGSLSEVCIFAPRRLGFGTWHLSWLSCQDAAAWVPSTALQPTHTTSWQPQAAACRTTLFWVGHHLTWRGWFQVRDELSFAISQPIEHPERFAAMGLSTATGVLLYGPPGARPVWSLLGQFAVCHVRMKSPQVQAVHALALLS